MYFKVWSMVKQIWTNLRKKATSMKVLKSNQITFENDKQFREEFESWSYMAYLIKNVWMHVFFWIVVGKGNRSSAYLI